MGVGRALTQGRRAALVAVVVAGQLALAPSGAAADPPVPHPDYTLIGDLALCGTIRVGTLTIPSGRTLRVATAADPAVVIPSRAGDPPQSNCTAAGVGRLTIDANRIVNHGTIDATGTQSAPVQPPEPGTPPTGNGGGGHDGAGGDGSTGAGGSPYTSAATRTDPVTEAGAPGAGAGRGAGGGELVLRAVPRQSQTDPATYVDGVIVSTGTIRANGTNAAADTSGTCGAVGQTGEVQVPLSGNHGPGGGGAGGGIVLEAFRVELSGPIQARGGDGGFGRLGGGGGGGGGVVKVLASRWFIGGGASVDVAGGSAGHTCTSGALPNPAPFPGTPGGPGDSVRVVVPEATATELSSAPNPSIEGDAVTFTATVGAGPGVPGTPTPPTGTVVFSQGSTTLGSETLDGNGEATLTTSTLPVGTHTITATYSGDETLAGSTGTVTHTVEPADTTPPVITPTVTPASPDGTNGWYRSNVSVTWTVVDSESAFTTTGCAPATLDADGSLTSSCSATSAGGTSSESVTVKRDATAPTITPLVTPGAPNGANGWYVTAPTVSFTCADVTSGPPSCSGPTTLASSAVAQTVTGSATDGAGNTASATVSGLLVDLVDPTVTCAATPTFTVGQPGAVSATVTDAHSGPAASSVTVPVSTATAGSFTAPVTGADVAGNTEAVACPYAVQRVGTVLHAHPVLLRLGSGISISLPLSARLTTASGAPITGQPVTMWVAGRPVCTATTGPAGWASCGNLLDLLAAILSGGFTATYLGSGTFAPSADSAGLIE
jgi:hypothetical protein